MKRVFQTAIQMMLTGILLLLFTVPGFAEVRLEPNKASVEQGFQLLTLDVEGAENFRFTGRKDGLTQYRGKIKPGSKLKFVFKASLQDEKALPVTGRSCTMRMQVVAKKGVEVIKTQNFSKENKSNLFLNYTVPQDADVLEVSETFELINKSKDAKFNKKVISRSHLILSAKDTTNKVAELVLKAGIKIIDDSDGKANVVNLTKDESEKASSGKIDANSCDMESKESSMGIIAAAVVLLLAAGGGMFFFMKKRKASQAAVAKEAEQKERLRQQEIAKQQAEQKKQEIQRLYEEMKERNRKRAEELAREKERQQDMLRVREAEQQPVSAQNAVNAIPPAGAKPVCFCSNCGARLEPGSTFCKNCGAKMQ